MADIIGLVCTTCKRRNYTTTVNKKNAKKLEIKKYCKWCNASVMHKQAK